MSYQLGTREERGEGLYFVEWSTVVFTTEESAMRAIEKANEAEQNIAAQAGRSRPFRIWIFRRVDPPA